MAARLASTALAFLFLALVTAPMAGATFAVQTSKGLYANVSGEWTLLYAPDVDGFGVSPDGNHVAYSPFSGEQASDVLIENVKTNSVKNISPAGIGWSDVRYTPGGQIVGSGYSEGLGGYGIYLMNSDGSGLRKLVSGIATAPVVSSKGALAYLAGGGFGQDDLYILDPSPSGKAVPRLLASGNTYGATGGPPSFSPNGERILFPRSSKNYIVDVSTGSVTGHTELWDRPEWEGTSSVLAIEPVRILRQFIGTKQSFTAATIPSGSSAYWVRAEPEEAEVSPPEAIASMDLLQELAPEIRYDSQEPYFADSAYELTDGFGFNGNGDLYTPLLYNEENEVLADPFFESPEFAAEHNHTVEGSFGLWLDALGPYYHGGFSYPDPNGVAKSGDWVDEPNGTHMADAGRMHSEGYGDVAYGRIVKQGSDLWLQYWLWYYYNNGQVGFGDHEGDWEMIQVHLDSSYSPDEVVFSAHSHAARCGLGEFELSSGGGPVVYVARGSHGSYPEEGEYETEVSLFVDTAFPDAQAIPPVVPTIVDLVEQPPVWLDWPGRWGGSESSPHGPKQHEDQWHNPNGWAGEAEGCLDRKVGSLQRRAALKSTWVNDNGVASKPLKLTHAAVEEGRVRVAYTAAKLRKPRTGWPKLLLSIDAPGDRLPPKSVVLRKVKNRGVYTLPFEVTPKKRWRVRGSLFAPRLRSPVVVRQAQRP